MDQEPSTSRGQLVWILAAVLFMLILSPLFLNRWAGGTPRDPATIQTTKGEAGLLIDGDRYLARDSDDDGHVDCLLRPGAGAILGIAAWGTTGGTQRCGGPFRGVLSDEVARELDRLVAERYSLRAGQVSPVDLDGDGRTDCAVSIYQPERTIWASRDATTCPGIEPPSRTMSAEQREAFDRILALEFAVSRLVAVAP